MKSNVSKLLFRSILSATVTAAMIPSFVSGMDDKPKKPLISMQKPNAKIIEANICSICLCNVVELQNKQSGKKVLGVKKENTRTGEIYYDKLYTLSSCGHSYCKSCIKGWMTNKQIVLLVDLTFKSLIFV